MPAPCWRIPQPETGLREVIDRQLSVRQTEALAARDPSAEATPADGLRRSRDPDTAALERAPREQLGLNVKVTFNGRRGAVQFYYTDLDQLDNLLSRLGLRQ